MAGTSYFRDGSSSLITITGGTQVIALTGLSYDYETHYFYIVFEDSVGNVVTPTGGTVLFEGAQSARKFVWDGISNGSFNAIDVYDPARSRPKATGPLVAARLTLDGITGADVAAAKVTGY